MQKLVDIMKALRAPDGCPWDKVQTHKTLKKCSMEECAELMDAIEDENELETVYNLIMEQLYEDEDEE